jgi:SagB-type dehydrogenase family enzyme
VFAGKCAVTFIWSVVPYRTEWRYTVESKKIILQDSGHMGQNLYLACESINCGTCAIGAYDQKKFDKLCGLDGKDEFVVYVSPVGRAVPAAPAA